MSLFESGMKVSECDFVWNGNFPFTMEKFNELPEFDTFMLTYNDEIIGYILSRNGECILNILSIEILPQYRGNGLGRKFLNNILEKKCSKNVMVVVDWDSIDSKNFFLSCGFKEFDNNSPHVLVKKFN
jgi:N-acetylglutamate synthase-like GNAT family acetyltransferase